MIRLPFMLVGILVLALLVGFSAPALAVDATGKVKSVEADKSQFVMIDSNNKNWTIHLGANAKVFLNEKEAKLADIQADDEVSIKYEKEGEKLVASEVRCKRKE
jgi:Cu/Ag efflux protein CusF